MRLSFPHPLLVWSGHVESTGEVVVAVTSWITSAEVVSSILDKIGIFIFAIPYGKGKRGNVSK